jgi:hypothetical protein
MRRARRDIAIATGLVALCLVARSALADNEEPYLDGEGLIAAVAGATFIGSNWAEYYAPDGTIVGKVRYLGMLREFRGRWTAKRDQVCFEYEMSRYNTCSKFREVGDRMHHFGADGRPKPDAESRRLSGNRLGEFR